MPMNMEMPEGGKHCRRDCEHGDFSSPKPLPQACQKCKYMAIAYSLSEEWKPVRIDDSEQAQYHVLVDGVVVTTSNRPWL